MTPKSLLMLAYIYFPYLKNERMQSAALATLPCILGMLAWATGGREVLDLEFAEWIFF